jgi:integrase/recombinase XerD
MIRADERGFRMLLSEALQGFYYHLQGSGYSPSTVVIYQHYLGMLNARLNDPDMLSITSVQLTQFMSWLATEYVPIRVNGDTSPVRPSSLSNAWASIRSFFKWHAEQIGNDRPDLALKRPKVRYEEVRPLTKEECERLVKAAREVTVDPKDGKASYVMHHGTGERNAAIIMTFLDTGMRLSELSRLTVGDLNLVTGEIHIKPFRSGQKTSGRYVYIGKSTRAVVWKYLAKRKEHDDLIPKDPLFATVDGLHFERTGIYGLITRIAERANVKDCYPHKLRHTFAVTYIRNGGDAFALQKLLGHTDLEMTKRYVAIAKADVETEIRHYGIVDNWKL